MKPSRQDSEWKILCNINIQTIRVVTNINWILIWQNNFFEKYGCYSLKVHKILTILAFWIKQFGEHLVMIYFLEVGQNTYHILANTAKFNDMVYQISPHWRQQIAWFKILVYSVLYVFKPITTIFLTKIILMYENIAKCL